jgi:hypothetical protein
MAEGTLVNEHVIKLVGYAQRLEKLSFLVSEGLGTRILLASLPHITWVLSWIFA